MSGDLGFAGMTAIGTDPQAAWDSIHERCLEPTVRVILDQMQGTPQGRAALETSRQRWADLGFPPPWEDDPGPEYRPHEPEPWT